MLTGRLLYLCQGLKRVAFFERTLSAVVIKVILLSIFLVDAALQHQGSHVQVYTYTWLKVS